MADEFRTRRGGRSGLQAGRSCRDAQRPRRPRRRRRPNEIVIDIGFGQAAVGDQRARTLRRHAARDRTLIAGRDGIARMHQAIGELHVVAAMIAEGPVLAVALHAQAVRRAGRGAGGRIGGLRRDRILQFRLRGRGRIAIDQVHGRVADFDGADVAGRHRRLETCPLHMGCVRFAGMRRRLRQRRRDVGRVLRGWRGRIAAILFHRLRLHAVARRIGRKAETACIIRERRLALRQTELVTFGIPRHAGRRGSRPAHDHRDAALRVGEERFAERPSP